MGTLSEKAKLFAELKAKKAKLEREAKDVGAQMSDIELEIIEELVNEGMQSIKLTGVGHFSLSMQHYPRIKDQDTFFSYLFETQQDHMMKTTVNANTLRGWWNNEVKDLDPENIGLEVYSTPKISFRKD